MGVAYVWTVLNGSGLWVKCTISVELEILSNGRVLGIGHVMVCSSHIEYGAW
jgi:flagellar motor switch/type III secretory pathway protein FliN